MTIHIYIYISNPASRPCQAGCQDVVSNGLSAEAFFVVKAGSASLC